MVTYRRRGFSIRDKRKQHEEHRVHFRPSRGSKRIKIRPIWWLAMLAIIILGLIFYLNQIAH